MTPPRPADDDVRLPRPEFEDLLEEVAAPEAKKALADVGLEGDTAAADIRDLRSLVDALKVVRNTALQTLIHVVVTGLLVLVLVIVGAAVRMKLFGFGS